MLDFDSSLIIYDNSFLLLISFGFNVYYMAKGNDVEIKEKTTIVTRTDTIRDTVLLIRKENVVKVVRDTLRLVEVIHDSSNVVVDIPIVQKEYSDDSTYTAWVSGYKPQLDSISIYRKNVSISKETVITKKDRKKFGIGPMIYGGFNIGSRKMDYGVGIGISYHIWEF